MSLITQFVELINYWRPTPRKSVKVLIVEDNMVDQGLAENMIRSARTFDTEVVASQRQALRKIQDAEILWLDWRIQGADATTLLFEWLDTKGGLPVFVVSANMTERLRTELLTRGAFNAVGKPVNYQLVSSLMIRYRDNVLRHRQAKEFQQFKITMFGFAVSILITLASIFIKVYGI